MTMVRTGQPLLHQSGTKRGVCSLSSFGVTVGATLGALSSA